MTTYRSKNGRPGPDIKAPDYYLLGGWRKVNKQGLILFHRIWWKCPLEWVGEWVCVHVTHAMLLDILDAAPPGKHIYLAKGDKTAIEIYPFSYEKFGP